MSFTRPGYRVGKLFLAEGPDGVGKSTVAAHITAHLRSRNIPVISARLPGGTAVGEAVRLFFKQNAAHLPIEDQIAMNLLAMRQLVHEVIRPALEAGTYVVCDRFTDSLYAYQWAGFSEFDPAIKQRIDDNILLYGVDIPADLKIVLDCPVQVSLERMGQGRAGEHDVLDQMNRHFKSRVRSYYQDHLKESAYGHTCYVNTVEGQANTLAIVERLVNVLCFDRAPQHDTACVI